ncbi:MAG TPA: HAD hydrolase family protein [candidate division Zixibacteria bacterium]|nr:HAD hydrolase family protein [candidate division Zixibacteria bacterium]
MKRISAAVRNKARKIKLLLVDVDGVLTDGRIIFDSRGTETKEFDVRDGLGIVLLKRSGIEVGFVTSRSSAIVSQRARELGVALVRQGVATKLDAYREIKAASGLRDAEIACAGDDLMDLGILRRCGLAIAVADASGEVLKAADYVTRAGGGRGAVREIAELLLKAQGKWRQVVASYL